MVSTPVIVALVILVVTSIFTAVYGMRRPAPTKAPARRVRRTLPPPTSPPSTPAPPPAVTATPSPAPTRPAIYYPDYYPNVYPNLYPPGPPPGWIISAPMPSYQLVPGAAWPFLHGRHRDDVASWLLTSYPGLQLRVIPFGTAVTYEVRNDRITIVYDTFTQRVVSARIG